MGCRSPPSPRGWPWQESPKRFISGHFSAGGSIGARRARSARSFGGGAGRAPRPGAPCPVPPGAGPEEAVAGAGAGREGPAQGRATCPAALIAPARRARHRSTMSSREHTVGTRRERGADGACGSLSLPCAGIPGQRQRGRAGTARELASPSIARGGDPPSSSAGVRVHPAPVPLCRLRSPPIPSRQRCLAGGFLGVLCPVAVGEGVGEPVTATLSASLHSQHFRTHTAKPSNHSQDTVRLEIKIANHSRSQTSRSACQLPSPTPWIWDGSSGSLWLCVCFPGFKSEPEEILT